MNTKKLIFVLGCPRSGTTLLLSYLCGLKNTKILYETKTLTMLGGSINELAKTAYRNTIANYFDSFEEEIVVEKTPEHVFYLEDIEKLREVCKRDIHVIYVLRPPVPTILSLVKAAKINPEIWGEMDILGACEKYEESLVSIYHNLILKSNKPNTPMVDKHIYSADVLGNIREVDFYQDTTNIPYSFCISYRELVDNPYKIIKNLLENLYIEADIQSLIDNRITNIVKVVPQITNEKCHVNIFKSTKEVQKLRREVVDKDVKEYGNEIKYISSYFEHPKTKESIYDLVSKKQLVDTQKNPLVTIVVPLYNKEDYIRQVLDSLINQTYQNIRVLVIDDASTDKSLEIAEEYYETLTDEQKGKLWIIRGEHNQGVPFTRNIGLLVFADIYSFCDADDVWDSTLVEKSVNIFLKYPYVDGVYSRVLNEKDNTIVQNVSKICNGNVYQDALEYNFTNCGSNLFIKASVIEESSIKFNNGLCGCEDWDFVIQLSKVAVFKCTKEYLVTYKQDVPNSMSSDRPYQFEGCKRVIEKYIKDRNSFKRIFTRHYSYYFSTKLLKWKYIKNLDFKYILRVVVSKLKSFVKSYLP